ncbi:MAG: hypothetical protein VB939_07115, partial [Pseudomonadales bacterium]
DVVAIYSRGLEYLTQGRFEDAKKDIDEAYKLGLKVHEVRANQAYVQFVANSPFSTEGQQAYRNLEAAVAEKPQDALFRTYLAEMQQARADIALQQNWGVEHIGMYRVAILPSDWDRAGGVSACIAVYEQANSNLDEVIDIAPDLGLAYLVRSKIFRPTS